MLAVRAALDELTLEEDGVDGQGDLPLRRGLELRRGREQRAVRAGHAGPARRHRASARSTTGCATPCTAAARSTAPRRSSRASAPGLGTDPNGTPVTPSQADQLADLGHADRPGQARPRGQPPRLRAHGCHGRDRARRRARLPGSPAGYADQPDEVINYVDAHDNETLYDLSVFKLPTDTSMADRVRMNTLSLATVDAVAVALVLARRHRAAALEVARPQQLQLGRLVQPHRLDRPGVDLRLGPAGRGRQRRQVADHGAAAREPGAQAGRGGHRRGRGIRARPAARARRRSTCCSSARRSSSTRR